MADNVMGGIGQITGEVGETVKEVVKDIKDSVGEALEQGVQTAMGSPLTPQQIQQKQQEDTQKLAETRGKIAWYKNISDEQKKVIEENKKKEEMRLQSQKQEKKVSEAKKEEKKKQPINPAVAYAGKIEIKRGVGG